MGKWLIYRLSIAVGRLRSGEDGVLQSSEHTVATFITLPSKMYNEWAESLIWLISKLINIIGVTKWIKLQRDGGVGGVLFFGDIHTIGICKRNNGDECELFQLFHPSETELLWVTKRPFLPRKNKSKGNWKKSSPGVTSQQRKICKKKGIRFYHTV